jgi:hypothetical protein
MNDNEEVQDYIITLRRYSDEDLRSMTDCQHGCGYCEAIRQVKKERGINVNL